MGIADGVGVRKGLDVGGVVNGAANSGTVTLGKGAGPPHAAASRTANGKITISELPMFAIL